MLGMTESGDDRSTWERIVQRRAELDLTWPRVAELTGVSRSTFDNIKKGRAPQRDTRLKIEAGLGMPIGSLAPPRPDTSSLSAEQVQWLDNVMREASRIESEAGPEAADAYTVGMLKKRREQLAAIDHDANKRDVG